MEVGLSHCQFETFYPSSQVCFTLIYFGKMSNIENNKSWYCMSQAISKIQTAIQQFEVSDSVLLHETLEINLPSGFYRYDEIDQNPEKKWSPVELLIIYTYKTLRLEVHLTQVEIDENIIIESCAETVDTNNRRHYKFAKPVLLTLRQAKQLVNFMQNYFCVLDLRINTKLSR